MNFEKSGLWGAGGPLGGPGDPLGAGGFLRGWGRGIGALWVGVWGSGPFGVGIEDLTTLFKYNLFTITTTLKSSSKTSSKIIF